jgi:hypothetical protein
VRFNQKPGSSFRSAASRSGTVNPFNVPATGANPNTNSLFSHNVTPGATNGAFANPVASRNGGTYQFGDISCVETALPLNGFKNEDISIIENTPIREGVDLQRKFEMLNALNRHAWGVPSLTPTDTLFGVPTGTLTMPRNSQITAHVRF